MARGDGYVKISRQLEDWEHFDNLALTGFWIHLLLRANWKPTARLKPGELYLTYDGIAEECSISRSTVRRYLNTLRESGEIQTITERRKTKVRIINWKRFQQVQNEPRDEPNDEPRPEPRPEPRHEPDDEPQPGPGLPYIKREEGKKERKKEEKEKSLKENETYQPPTADEVREYAKAEGLSLDPDHFVDYYQNKDWIVSGEKVKDWRYLVRSWARKDKEFSKGSRPKKSDELPDWYDANPKRTTGERKNTMTDEEIAAAKAKLSRMRGGQ